MVKYIRKKLCAILTGGGLSALIWSLIFLPVQTIFATPVSAALPPATSGDFASVPPVVQIGVKPNVLIILDNSNSMDTDVDGNGVGSQAPNSRSEIARHAMQAMIAQYQASMRFGLMAYNQGNSANPTTTNLNPTTINQAYFDISYCSSPSCRASDTLRNQSAPVSPVDPLAGNFYYPTGLASSGYLNKLQPEYCYYINSSSYATTCGLNQCTAYPFYCCSQKTATPTSINNKTPPNQSLATLQSNYGYGGTCARSDFITLEGTQADVQTGAAQSPWGQEMAFSGGFPAYTAAVTPGDGLLHVDIADSAATKSIAGNNITQITLLNNKLAAQQVIAPAPPDGYNIPIRNAGDTPMPGTLQSALNYFQGHAVTAAPGVTATNPITQPCQKSYVIYVTDGLPTTMPDGSLGTPAQLLNASMTQVNALRGVTNVGNPGGSDGNGKAFDVKTFVVGFAMADSLDTLNQLAQAGGTGNAYDANDAQSLNSALATIFQQITQDASSGMAPVVNTNSRSGEGGAFPAMFYPRLQDKSGNTALWAGDVAALFVDTSGRLREDTNGNQILDDTGVSADRIVSYNSDGVGFATPVAALPEINTITMPGATALGGKYFFINAANGQHYYVCFNVDDVVIPDSSINSNSSGAVYRQRLEVQLASTDLGSDVAAKTARILANSMVFQTTASGTQITITTILPGSVEYMDANGNKVATGGDSIGVGNSGITMNSHTPGGDPSTTNVTTGGDKTDIHYLWSASDWLASVTDATTQRAAYNSTAKGRYIFTFVDSQQNGIAADTAATPAFTAPANPALAPLIPISEKTSGPITINGAHVAATPSDVQKMTARVINFIRGQDQPTATLANGATLPAFRSRQIKYKNDTQPRTWRLGDIIHSNPLVVERPNQGYKSIYGDNSYATFMAKYANRRTVIYVGANDGMLHAFNGGFYENRYSADLTSTNNPVMRYLQQPVQQPVQWQSTGTVAIDTTNFTKYDLGAELWAYVPYNLLGHLYWLTEAPSGADLSVNHVYYVDLTPVSYDVQIFPTDDDHPGGWGTILVGGMGFGGGRIDSCYSPAGNNGDCSSTRAMSSAYFIFDITNPEKPPKLLTEFALPRQGYTTGVPALSYFKDNSNPSSATKFFLVFGSGPANAAGQADGPTLQSARSGQNARLFYLQLPSSGQPLSDLSSWRLPAGTLDQSYSKCRTDSSQECSMQIVGGTPAYVSDMVSTDIDLDYKIDAFYYGTVTSEAGGSLSGALRRVLTNASSDPSNWITDSTLINLAAAGLKQPISAAANTAYDSKGNLFVYFNTGRYLTADDRSNNDQQALYGVKEPRDTDGKFTWATVNYASLYNSTNVQINVANSSGVEVTGGVGTDTSWQNFLSYMDSFSGWVHQLAAAGSSGMAERAINQPTITNKLFLTTTFVPSDPTKDVCNNLGESYLYPLYYGTGTAAMTTNGPLKIVYSLGAGLASPPSVNFGNGTTTVTTYSTAGTSTTTQLPGSVINSADGQPATPPGFGGQRLNWGIISE